MSSDTSTLDNARVPSNDGATDGLGQAVRESSPTAALDAGSIHAVPHLWSGRLPFLDALRGISILIVVGNHLQIIYFNRSDPVPWYAQIRGSVGVDIFFVISGFLITVLLAREQASRGRICLSDFYKRRVLRIFPAYFTFVIVAHLIAWAENSRIPTQVSVAATTFTMSFLGKPYGPGSIGAVWNLSHLWSLSTEELFYLIWPAIYVSVSHRKAFWVAAFYAIATPPLRYIAIKHAQWAPPADLFAPLRCDSIAFGCCLALFMMRGKRNTQKIPANNSLYFILFAFFAILILFVVHPWLWSISNKYSIYYRNTLLGSMDSASVMVIIATLLYHPRSLSWIDMAPFRYLGIISYSLYLWQQPFMNATRPASIIFRPPYNVFFAIAAACVSFFAIERPFLKLKGRIAQSRGLHVPGET